jgi:hypothetical protein
LPSISDLEARSFDLNGFKKFSGSGVDSYPPSASDMIDLRWDFLRPGVSTKPGRSGFEGVFPACERVTRIDMVADVVLRGSKE